MIEISQAEAALTKTSASVSMMSLVSTESVSSSVSHQSTTGASPTTPTSGKDTKMSDEHVVYEDVAAARRATAGYREGYDEARRAFLIGQAIQDRRLALGLSQSDVATRAGMTQPALSRLEAGGTVPTIPVLERIAVALGTELIVSFGPDAA